MAIVGLSRLGCFLQGCCYGVPVGVAGISFPPGSVVYYRHLRQGLIEAGAWSLPVVPTQLLSAVVLAALSVWSYRQLERGASGVFVRSVAAYSLWRFVVEFARADPGRNAWLALSTSQWIAVAIMALYTLSWAIARTVSRPTQGAREPAGRESVESSVAGHESGGRDEPAAHPVASK